MIRLDQLRVLATLHRTGSFTKTAESLHRAQSAISYAIKSLESELGIGLLDSTGYRAKFTPAVLRHPSGEQAVQRVTAIGRKQ